MLSFIHMGASEMTQLADSFAVWDQPAAKPKGLPAMKNAALRDLEYIPKGFLSLRQSHITKQNTINLEDLLPDPEEVIGLEGAHTKLHLLIILSYRR